MTARGVTGSAGTVLDVLADGLPRSAAEIGRRASLPRSTVVHTLLRLSADGQVMQHAPVQQGRGRPSRRWSVARPPGPILVVVSGAHGATSGVVSADGRLLASSGPTPSEAGERSVEAVLGGADAVLAAAGVGAGDLSLAVVGLPGASSFDRTPGSPAVQERGSGALLRMFRTWQDQDPVTVLGRHLGRPAYSENDANLAVLGEAESGAGRGRSTVLYVGLLHGTGAGLVVAGALHRGRSRLAGEIGHLHTDDDGRLCHCGARGCFWQSRSVPALLVELSEAHGRSYTAADLADAAAADDHDVVRALTGLGHALGRRLADGLVFLDPDAIVVDSGLGRASEVIADGIRQSLDRCAPPTMARATEVLLAEHGADAPLVGAAALARREGLLTPDPATRLG